MLIRSFCAALLLALSTASPVWAVTAFEQAQLVLMLRQLDNIERLAKASAEHAPDETARYRFDYERLAQDIQRMRTGMQGYLTPARAQPRDPGELSASYQRESASDEVVP